MGLPSLEELHGPIVVHITGLKNTVWWFWHGQTVEFNEWCKREQLSDAAILALRLQWDEWG